MEGSTANTSYGMGVVSLHNIHINRHYLPSIYDDVLCSWYVTRHIAIFHILHESIDINQTCMFNWNYEIGLVGTVQLVITVDDCM